jgi:hypothetical protein
MTTVTSELRATALDQLATQQGVRLTTYLPEDREEAWDCADDTVMRSREEPRPLTQWSERGLPGRRLLALSA